MKSSDQHYSQIRVRFGGCRIAVNVALLVWASALGQTADEVKPAGPATPPAERAPVTMGSVSNMTTWNRQFRALMEGVFTTYAENNYDAIKLGYAPKKWNVKDFSLVKFEGRWHLFHILGQDVICLSPEAECRVGHASTADFVTWTTHDPVVPAIPDTWESHHIYAPFVFRWQNRFHMIYTGINRNMYECLGSASSIDLFRWQRNPAPIIDPLALGWADADPSSDVAARGYSVCRDPHVYIEGETLHLYFSAREKGTDMPVIGVATSKDARHWQDGGIAYRGWDNSWNVGGLLESSCVHRLDSGKYFLTFNTRGRVRYVIGDTPLDFKSGQYHDLPTAENFTSLEVIARNPGKWLVAYFGGKAGCRMSLGILEWKGDSVVGGKRIESRDELAEFKF